MEATVIMKPISVRSRTRQRLQNQNEDRFVKWQAPWGRAASATWALSLRLRVWRLQRRAVAVGMLASLLATATPAEAQLFGDRILGQPVAAGSAERSPMMPLAGLPLAEIGVGRVAPELGGFVGRGAVTRDRFVGRADAAASALELVALQELDRARAAESRRRRTRNANVLQVGEGRSVGPAYDPRLTIAFDYPALTARPNELRVEQSIEAVLAGEQFARVTVAVSDGQATLSGAVESHKVRQLAEAIVYLEPGVEVVVNELQVDR